MIRFRCSHCGKKLKAPEEYAGRQVQCTGCGAVQSVPELAGETRTQVLSDLEIAATVSQAPAGYGALPGGESGGAGEGEPRTFGGKKELTDDGLDMTPMVDVTFLLLIFFMVTAAFALQKSIQIPTPDPSDSAAQSRTVEELEDDDDNVIIRIDRDNTIWVNDSEAPSEQELLSLLKQAREGGPGMTGKGPGKLIVMANGEARHEKVVMALDAGTAAGFDDVRLASGDEDF
ncbi:MAG TPA: biopolymer transporter ExbD [Pirellulales bacterium]|nr:biopolymer transporter ExbD [Pirellulales bacterium]